jgi:hypothetical protein
MSCTCWQKICVRKTTTMIRMTTKYSKKKNTFCSYMINMRKKLSLIHLITTYLDCLDLQKLKNYFVVSNLECFVKAL